MRGIVRVLGVGFLLVGTILLAGPIFGFSTLSADRSVAIGVSDDGSALITIDTDVYDGESSITAGESQPLVELGNNFDQTVGGEYGTVLVEVTGVSGDNQLEPDDIVMANDPSIASGSSEAIEFICSSESPPGNREADITLEIIEISGATVSVENRVLEEIEGVHINCGDDDSDEEPDPADDFQLIDNSVHVEGGMITFEIENTADDRTITDFAVESNIDGTDNLWADEDNEFEIEAGDRTAVYDSGVNQGHRSYDTDGTIQPFDSTVTIESSERASVTVQEFGSGSGGNWEVYEFGELQPTDGDPDISITLVFDGKQTTFDFQEAN